MPDNTSMTLLNAVAPGVCNFLKADDADKFAKNIIDKIKDVEGRQLLQNDQASFVNSLIDALKIYDIEMKKDITFNLSLKDEERDVDEEEYIHHDDKSYKIKQFSTGDNVINKEYSRNNYTEKNDSDWNFKINVMNATGFPELIEILKGRTTQNDNTYVTLEEIVNYLQKQGVKHIILLDLSCSSFISMPPPKEESLMDIDDDDGDDVDGEETITNKRLIRNIRRDTMKKGGKRKQSRKKQKLTKKRRQTRRKRRQTRRKQTLYRH